MKDELQHLQASMRHNRRNVEAGKHCIALDDKDVCNAEKVCSFDPQERLCFPTYVHGAPDEAVLKAELRDHKVKDWVLGLQCFAQNNSRDCRAIDGCRVSGIIQKSCVPAALVQHQGWLWNTPTAEQYLREHDLRRDTEKLEWNDQVLAHLLAKATHAFGAFGAWVWLKDSRLADAVSALFRNTPRSGTEFMAQMTNAMDAMSTANLTHKLEAVRAVVEPALRDALPVAAEGLMGGLLGALSAMLASSAVRAAETLPSLRDWSTWLVPMSKPAAELRAAFKKRRLELQREIVAMEAQVRMRASAHGTQRRNELKIKHGVQSIKEIRARIQQYQRLLSKAEAAKENGDDDAVAVLDPDMLQAARDGIQELSELLQLGKVLRTVQHDMDVMSKPFTLLSDQTLRDRLQAARDALVAHNRSEISTKLRVAVLVGTVVSATVVTSAAAAFAELGPTSPLVFGTQLGLGLTIALWKEFAPDMSRFQPLWDFTYITSTLKALLTVIKAVILDAPSAMVRGIARGVRKSVRWRDAVATSDDGTKIEVPQKSAQEGAKEVMTAPAPTAPPKDSKPPSAQVIEDGKPVVFY